MKYTKYKQTGRQEMEKDYHQSISTPTPDNGFDKQSRLMHCKASLMRDILLRFNTTVIAAEEESNFESL